MKSVITAVSVFALLAFSSLAFSQTVPPPDPFPSQFIAAGVTFESQSTPNFASGFIAYGKNLSQTAGTFSYSMVRETNFSLKPKPQIMTQTETGLCVYTTTVLSFKAFTCGTVGGSAVGGNTGLSTSGTALLMKPLKNGYDIGFAAGPSYSGASGSLQWPVSVVVLWGK